MHYQLNRTLIKGYLLTYEQFLKRGYLNRKTENAIRRPGEAASLLRNAASRPCANAAGPAPQSAERGGDGC